MNVGYLDFDEYCRKKNVKAYLRNIKTRTI